MIVISSAADLGRICVGRRSLQNLFFIFSCEEIIGSSPILFAVNCSWPVAQISFCPQLVFRLRFSPNRINTFEIGPVGRQILQTQESLFGKRLFRFDSNLYSVRLAQRNPALLSTFLSSPWGLNGLVAHYSASLHDTT